MFHHYWDVRENHCHDKLPEGGNDECGVVEVTAQRSTNNVDIRGLQ